MLKAAHLVCASPANIAQAHNPTLLSPCALSTKFLLKIIAWQHAWTCPLAVCNQFPVLRFCGFLISSKAPGRVSCFQLSFVSARKTQQTPVSREPAQMFPSTPGPTMTTNASCTHPACVPYQYKAACLARRIESAPGLHTIETRFQAFAACFHLHCSTLCTSLHLSLHISTSHYTNCHISCHNRV